MAERDNARNLAIKCSLHLKIYTERALLKCKIKYSRYNKARINLASLRTQPQVVSKHTMMQVFSL